MSANNYILVKQTKTGWEVSHRDMDSNNQLGDFKKFKRKQNAFQYANDLQEELMIVEGGMHIQQLCKSEENTCEYRRVEE